MSSKKGSSIVEATIVLPMIILVLIGLVAIVSYMYKGVEKNVATHLAITNAIGVEEETTYYYGRIPKGIQVKKTQGIFTTKVEASTPNISLELGILTDKFQKNIVSRGEGTNEKDYILGRDLFKGEE